MIEGFDQSGVEWRRFSGYESLYSVSDSGLVYSHELGRAMSRQPYRKYAQHELWRDGLMERWLAHRMVATMFIPNPSGLPVVRHLDGDSRNNSHKNLAWGTQTENMQDRIAHGNNPNLSKTECPHGHRYTDENTYTRPGGSRKCRACQSLGLKRNIPEDSKYHGTITGYVYGCRCARCKEARREYRKAGK